MRETREPRAAFQDHTTELPATPSQALAAVEEAAEMWGGDWQPSGSGGRLTLPISAGLRHGHVAGELSARPRGDVSEIVFSVERMHYRLHWPSFFVLLFGAVGALVILAAPMLPVLFPLVPAGLLVSLAAWFLVVTKVRTRGSREFFGLVGDLVTQEAGSEPEHLIGA